MGMDPDYSKRDMHQQIQSGIDGEGEFPECKSCMFTLECFRYKRIAINYWDLPGTAYIQTMTAEQAEATSFDAFDVTKVWPRDQFPLQEFGRIVLNKNPDNYHRDVDQAAFSPSSLVPGIEASPDMLLQWRKYLLLVALTWLIFR